MIWAKISKVLGKGKVNWVSGGFKLPRIHKYITKNIREFVASKNKVKKKRLPNQWKAFLKLLYQFPVSVVKVIFQIRVSVSWYNFNPAFVVQEPFPAGGWKTFG